MTRVGDIAAKVRSKNAGPFWLTIDVFCADSAAFTRLSQGLKDTAVARLFQITPDSLLRFDISDLKVIKFSLPRPAIQGARADRDMHGAAFAELLADLEFR